MKLRLCCMMLALLFCSMAMAQTTWTVTVNWTPRTEVDLAGYRIYESATTPVCDEGELPGADPLVDIPVEGEQPDPFTWDLEDVEEGTHYYIVTAYDISGNESLCSQEAAVYLDTLPPQQIDGFEVVKVVAYIGVPVAE